MTELLYGPAHLKIPASLTNYALDSVQLFALLCRFYNSHLDCLFRGQLSQSVRSYFIFCLEEGYTVNTGHQKGFRLTCRKVFVNFHRISPEM